MWIIIAIVVGFSLLSGYLKKSAPEYKDNTVDEFLAECKDLSKWIRRCNAPATLRKKISVLKKKYKHRMPSKFLNSHISELHVQLLNKKK